ncbi:hypothetical protein AKJ36_02525 [candidate division MSBL1 archaeon SCGC-AAA259I07]|uniref:Uncharacterized protein n=1 Tax=candidate division MSBL1 archaeon SCGC-AAA259I07 TaxID=1698266 RepID=A0A133UKD5_9EURY|nr:hypothetical protein AKJ36_02525 [candidate division MSBL1 archaeon SCGC-AAA259I07]
MSKKLDWKTKNRTKRRREGVQSSSIWDLPKFLVLVTWTVLSILLFGSCAVVDTFYLVIG